MPRATHDELSLKARFIFEGTVRERGAATMESVPVSDQVLVVHVDRILQSPTSLLAYLGKDVTVRLGKGGAKLEAGQRAVFYTNGWLFGDSIAVQSVGHLPVPRARRAVLSAAAGEPADAPQETLGQTDLQRRLATAETVVTGRVMSVRVPESPVEGRRTLAAGESAADEETAYRRPISEHDPEWREAVIEVQGVEKGSMEAENVVVRFPSSDDVQWYRAPKFEPGQEAVFLLHEKRPGARGLAAAGEAAEEEDVYVALDPADVQPTGKLPVIQALIARSESAPHEVEAAG